MRLLGLPVVARCLADRILALSHENRLPQPCCDGPCSAILCCATEDRSTGAIMILSDGSVHGPGYWMYPVTVPAA
jgi:hypothetical protein